MKNEYSLSRFTPRPKKFGSKEWFSVLKLSTLWAFGELRQQALNGLSSIAIDPVDRVMLAREYRVEIWLVEGYMELVRRDAGLFRKAQMRLGYETSLRLYEKREDTFLRNMESGLRRRVFFLIIWRGTFVIRFKRN